MSSDGEKLVIDVQLLWIKKIAGEDELTANRYSLTRRKAMSIAALREYTAG
jgi:hypothetical protein